MLVIGLGNRWRQDDGAGIAVIERLRGRHLSTPWVPAPADIIEAEDVLSLIDGWAAEDVVVIVDAVRSAAAAGTIHRIDATTQPLPTEWTFGSSHEIGLAHAVEIARASDRLPGRLVIIGIEGEAFGFGSGLTPAVADAIPAACRAVEDEFPGRAA